MASGMSSGAIAALVCNPIELVKTRQQSAGHTPGGHALARLRQIYRIDGLQVRGRGTLYPIPRLGTLYPIPRLRGSLP